MNNAELLGNESGPYHLSGGQPSEKSSSHEARNAARERERQNRAAAEEQRLECRDRYEMQIDSIDARLRSGYSIQQGESLKSRRRDLEEKKRDC